MHFYQEFVQSMKRTFLLSFCFMLSNAEVFYDTKMIADIIIAMERPSSVISTFCWPLHKKIRLYSALAGKNMAQANMMQFVNLNQTPRFYSQEQNVVFLADLACPDVIEYLNESSARTHFRTPFRWILIEDAADAPDDDIIPEAIAHFDIFPDAEVTLARQIDKDSFHLYLIYKISSESRWKTEFYGSWNIKQGFKKTLETNEATVLRRLDLEGYEIKICYVLTDNDSINHLTDEVNDHIDTITKVNFPTTNHLLDFLNANRKYYFANTWGYKVNGSWNGMTGFLVREEVEFGGKKILGSLSSYLPVPAHVSDGEVTVTDVCRYRQIPDGRKLCKKALNGDNKWGSPMFFTSERISIVDYISSPTPTRSKFVFQQPKLSYENNLFLLSFRWTVWYSTVGLVFLIFLTLLVVAFWEWKKPGPDKELKEFDAGILRARVGDIIILIFGAACQQGSPVELKGSLGRVVMLVLFLALMFLYTSYSANIVALLQSSSSQIRTLDDLLHSRIMFGVHDTVFNRYYFSTATEPVRKAIYEKKVAPPGVTPRFMSMEEGVKKMRKGLFAFHMETGVGYKFVGKYFEEGEKCGLKEIQYLQVIDPWLAVRKNTPYKEMFKIGMKRIQEHGLQSRENRLLYEKGPKCSGRESNFVSVSMVDCYPALLVLSYGSIIALLLLAIENVVHRRHILKNRVKRAMFE